VESKVLGELLEAKVGVGSLTIWVEKEEEVVELVQAKDQDFSLVRFQH
jgi:hypothetical protein